MGKPVVAIVGQTATGKSSLAIALARAIRGTVVSADSRQVYRGLDIGSGKVSKREKDLVPHVLLDVADPRRQYTASHFVRDARRAILAIHCAGRVPIVVGGTGFWIDALLRGQSLPAVRPDRQLRRQLARRTPAQLYARLARLDPTRARSIDRHNPVRLIRALEIVLATKQPVPAQTAKAPYDVLWLGLRPSAITLRKNIHERLHRRLRAGLIAEVRRLLAAGVPVRRLLNLGLEYRYVTLFLQGALTRPQLEEQLETAIWHYAKRQRTWFKRHPDIRWVKYAAEAKRFILAFLRRLNDSPERI